MARQAHGSKTTCVFVVTEVDQPVVAAFYEHLISEWELSQTDPMHLVLLLRDIRHTLNSSR